MGVKRTNKPLSKKEFAGIINDDIKAKGYSLVYAFWDKSSKNTGYRFCLCNGKLKSDEWKTSAFVRKDSSEQHGKDSWKTYFYALSYYLWGNDSSKYSAFRIIVSKDTDWKEYHDKLRYLFFIYRKNECEFREVKSVNSFLKDVIKDNIELKKNRNVNTYYRGQLGHWDLNPSLYRDKGWVKHETALNAQIICDRPNDFRDCKSSFDVLVKLKHYNQPSRLMDLTTNPLVALYFACDSMKANPSLGIGLVVSAYSKDGEEKISVTSDTVVMLSALTNAKHDPTLNSIESVCTASSIIPERHKKNGSSCKKCIDDFRQNKHEPKCFDRSNAVGKYIGEIAHQSKKESGSELYWDDLSYGELNQCILVKPPLNTDRIIQQQGCFIMCGLNPTRFDAVPDSLFDFFKPKTGKRIYYYLVPNNLDAILKELEVLGINKYYIYPDLEKDIEVKQNAAKEGVQ